MRNLGVECHVFFIFFGCFEIFFGGFQEKVSMLFKKISMLFEKIFMLFQEISMVFQKISMVFHEARPMLRFFFSRMKKKYAGIFQNNLYSVKRTSEIFCSSGFARVVEPSEKSTRMEYNEPTVNEVTMKLMSQPN